jgi:hypothetical protein
MVARFVEEALRKSVYVAENLIDRRGIFESDRAW